MKQCEDSMDLLRLDYYSCDCTIGRYDVVIKNTNEFVYGGFSDFIYPYEAKDEIIYTKEEAEDIYEDYSVEIKEWFDSMSYIINEEWYEVKERRSWGRKLKNGIHLLAMATCQNNNYIKLTLFCSALEAMLLNDSDKDAIASKLAERAAFLLCTEPNARIEVYNNIKKLYNQRCRFVHLGDTNTAPSEELEKRCKFLEEIVRDTLMELEGYLYPRWDAVQNKEIYLSFEDFINKVKFSGKID